MEINNTSLLKKSEIAADMQERLQEIESPRRSDSQKVSYTKFKSTIQRLKSDLEILQMNSSIQSKQNSSASKPEEPSEDTKDNSGEESQNNEEEEAIKSILASLSLIKSIEDLIEEEEEQQKIDVTGNASAIMRDIKMINGAVGQEVTAN